MSALSPERLVDVLAMFRSRRRPQGQHHLTLEEMLADLAITTHMIAPLLTAEELVFIRGRVGEPQGAPHALAAIPTPTDQGLPCPICGRRCRVQVARSMPPTVYRAYLAAGLDLMATCDKGAAAERQKLGVSYADVVEARVAESKRQAGLGDQAGR